MPSSSAAGWAETLERFFVEALALSARPIAAHFTGAHGHWKGEPVSLAVRAYVGPRTRYARVCTLSTGGGGSIGNVLVLPRPPFADGAVFGFDAVQLQNRPFFVAADLSPVTAEDRCARGAPSPREGLPAWAARWFSRDAIVERVERPTAARWAAVVTVASEALASPRRSGAPLDAMAEAQQRYVDDHRAGDRTLSLLGSMFSEAWAESFVRDVLFPTRLPPI